MNLVDSSGWLEFFSDDTNADFFAPVIEDTANLIVSTINIYEVFKAILRQKEENAALQAIALMQQGDIKEVTSSVALNAAKQSHKLKLPMADSIILATAQIYDATLWTQDSDFMDIPGIKFIDKKSK